MTYALSGNIWVTCRTYELSFHSINQAFSIVEVDNGFFDAVCGNLNRCHLKQLSKLCSDCCAGGGSCVSARILNSHE